MTIENTETARVLDAAETLCIHQGNATAEEVAQATRFPLEQVRAALTQLVVQARLIARPGGIYARALRREIRLPGDSYTGMKQSIAAMTGAR